MNSIRSIGKKVAFFFVAFTLAVGLVGSAVHAQQGIEAESPQLTAEELQQLQDLYQNQGTGSDFSGGYGAPIDYGSQYPGASGLGDGLQGLGMLGALSGGGMAPLLALAAVYLGNMVWILIVLYLLFLIGIVAVLYASIFKKFKRFSREQAMVSAWNATKKHIWFFVLILILQVLVFLPLIALFVLGVPTPGLVGLGGGNPGLFGDYTTPALWALGTVIAFFVALFAIGSSKITLTLVDGGKPRVADLFTGVTLLPKFILSLILYVFMILLPYVLLVAGVSFLADKVSPLQLFIGGSVIAVLLAIPVSNWLLRFYLFHIVVVDKKVWPLKALKLSSQYSKGAKTDLFLWLSLLFAIGWVGGSVPLALGLFFVYPLTSLAYTHAYRQLEKGSQV